MAATLSNRCIKQAEDAIACSLPPRWESKNPASDPLLDLTTPLLRRRLLYSADCYASTCWSRASPAKSRSCTVHGVGVHVAKLCLSGFLLHEPFQT